jgi:Eco57I restriction-modification methylase
LKAAYTDLSTVFYDRLQELFDAVDKGDAALNVPVYNGGLFMTQPDPADPSPEAGVARFLANCKIPDRALALGLDLMARDIDEKQHNLTFIDYKSLGVRQLGSIYEGLLEFKLRVAPEEMAVVKDKTEKIVPYAEAKQKKLPILKEGRGKDAYDKTYSRGNVYLENDRRERKATGSYYTPDYIVKYIVEHTVGPVITEKLETLRPIFREAERTLKAERDKVKALGRKDISPENETYKKFRQALNEAFFDLKVLDPAMGSGHFLVEAVDYITDQMTKILTAFKWSPVVHELAQTRQEIQQEMERQGVTIDMNKLTDLNLLKRRVLKSCIYGVDLNPMAVELAKVSLWLDCFTLGAPLSFLDHHMKCGNSLIGGNVQDVQDALSQNLWGSQFTYLLDATQLMRKVGELSDVTAQEVAESRMAYKGAFDALAPFKRLLDVWISEYFSNKGAKHTTRLYAGAIVADDYNKANSHDKKAIETAMAIAKDKRFFHWELEFPEVFFDETKRKENGGFDAVVGNPPYDELSEDALGRVIDEEPFLTTESTFKFLGGGRLNWYHYFIVLALKVLSPWGMHGFIVPMSLMSDQFTLSLRRWLLENHQLVAIEAFPQKDNPNKRIFFEAKLPTCIYLVRNEKASKAFQVRVHPANIIDETSPTYYPDVATLKTLDTTNLSIPQVSEKGWQILRKIAINTGLGKLSEVGAKPTSGEIVFNQQFRKYLTDNNAYTLVLRGSHVQRYELVDEAKQGEPVYLKKDLYLQEARPGSKAFDHLKERVVYQEGAAIDNWRRIIATLLPPGFICGHKICYFVDYNVSPKALLAVFNSKLVDWYITALSTNNSLSAYW